MHGSIDRASQGNPWRRQKPVFNENSPYAAECIGNEDSFKILFNYVAGKNEASHYDLFLSRDEESGYYVFNSDMTGAGGISGFFPLEDKTDVSVDQTISPVLCPGCRMKALAQGPVPYYGIDNYEKFCNGSAWSGGRDCEGLFADGDTPAIWDWGVTRWEVPKNQYFCMEVHGSFRYEEMQEASFFANGDLWVFVNNQLAVDLGGNHLAAPNYLPLDNLSENYSLQKGGRYPIDIFFCQRKPTMSGFGIKTNFRISQN